VPPGPLPPVLEEMYRDGGLRRCNCDRRGRQGEAAEKGGGDAAREPLVDDEDDEVPLLEELENALHRPNLVRQKAEPVRDPARSISTATAFDRGTFTTTVALIPVGAPGAARRGPTNRSDRLPASRKWGASQRLP